MGYLILIKPSSRCSPDAWMRFVGLRGMNPLGGRGSTPGGRSTTSGRPILDRKLNVGFAEGNPVHLAAMGALNLQCLLPGRARLFGSGSIPACAGDGSCSRPVPFIGGKYYWGSFCCRPSLPAIQPSRSASSPS